MNIFRNWLTRPSTPSEAARALSLSGHAQHHARVLARVAEIRADLAAGKRRPIAPRDEVVAGVERRRRAKS